MIFLHVGVVQVDADHPAFQVRNLIPAAGAFDEGVAFVFFVVPDEFDDLCPFSAPGAYGVQGSCHGVLLMGRADNISSRLVF